MLKIEHTNVVGWEAAIRGMRNPHDSWALSDSIFVAPDGDWYTLMGASGPFNAVEEFTTDGEQVGIGPNDLKLMMQLRKAGPDHRKFLRYIDVYCDITAPLYWWKEFETYRTVVADNPFDIEMNSCSTMHSITKKPFTVQDFSNEHFYLVKSMNLHMDIIRQLNEYRDIYINGGEIVDADGEKHTFEPHSKDIWWQIIQLLPSSYNQKRTLKMNYEVLTSMYNSRKCHMQDEWREEFCSWIRSLPYSQIITLEEKE